MAENIETKTSYAKGEEFEKLFAEFMKKDLGWEKHTIRANVKSHTNSKGTQVDVLGKRQDKEGLRLRKMGRIYLVAVLIAMAITAILFGSNSIDEDTAFVFLGCGAVLEIIGVIALETGRNRHTEHAWVECKNKNEKATRVEMLKSIEEFNGSKKSGDKEYRFIVHYFVSASGFVANALELAENNNVVCYYLKDDAFKKTGKWE